MVSIKHIAILSSTVLWLSASWQPVAGARGIRRMIHRALTSKEDKDDSMDTGDLGSEDIEETTSETVAGACFSGETTAIVKDKGPVSMKDLQVGDFVLTGNTETESYQPIYAFGHYHPSFKQEFYQIHFESITIPTTKKKLPPLEVSEDHLVFLLGQKDPVPASALLVGDELVFQKDDTSSENEPGSVRVTKISQVQRQGVYAPLTADGTIVVNGIKSSSYISLQPPSNKIKGDDAFVRMNNSGTSNSIRLSFLSQHSFVHVALTPFRLLCLSGMASSPCTELNEDGMTSYVSRGIQFAQWLDQQHQLVQVFALVVYAVFSAIVVPVEYIWREYSALHVVGAVIIWLMAKKFFAVRIGRSSEKPTSAKKDL